MSIRKTISITNQQDDWMKFRIANGDYTNDSKYVRDLLGKDQQEHEKLLALMAAIDEGLSSGVSNRDIQDILGDKKEQLRASGQIPTEF